MDDEFSDEFGHHHYRYSRRGGERVAVEEAPPPLPMDPEGDTLLKGFATTHRAKTISHGVKFTSREHLMIGLDTLADRDMSGALSQTLDALGKNDQSGMGVGFFMLTQPDRGDWYEKNIRRVVEAVEINNEMIKKGGLMFKGDWDYDGPGPWHKAGLTVWVDQFGFYLHHYAAYVGNRAEVRLCERLPEIAQLNIVRYAHTLTYETHGDRWSIPLVDLQAIYDNVSVPFDPERFLEELTNPVNAEEKKGKWADVTGPVGVTSDHLGVRCSVKLGYRTLWASSHDRDPDTYKPLPHHAYRIEDGCLTGPARERSSQFQNDWRDPIDLEVYLEPLVQYDREQIKQAGIASECLTRSFQRIQSRPDPYLNE